MPSAAVAICSMAERKEKRTEVVTLRLKPSTKAGLQAMAEADRRPFATFLAMILEDHFSTVGAKDASRPLAQAKSEAPAGRKRPSGKD